MLARLILTMTLTGFIPCAAVYFGMTKSYEQRAIAVRTAEVQNQCTILSHQITAYDYMANTSQPVINENLTMLTNIYNGRVLIIDPDLIIKKDTFNLFEGRTFLSDRVISCLQGKSTSIYDHENKYIEVTSPIYASDNAEVKGVLLASVATDTIVGNLAILRRNGRVITAVVTLLVALLGLLVGTLLLAPLRKMRGAFASVSDEHTDTIRRGYVYTEVEQLYDEFAKTLARLRLLDESRNEFVSNVSHELKTPLASMKVLADSLLFSENAPKELYREFLSDITKEIDRENLIISDLLNLVRLDKTQIEPAVEKLDVNQLVEETLERLRPIAAARQVEMIFESVRDVTAQLDPVKISLAFSNLAENAIKYNKTGGTVYVKLDADYRYMYLDVRDTGIGIEQKDLAHIFERFYRADKSHSREIGGTGLGLSIAKKIILLHKGTITAESTPGEGTKFSVRIPLVYKKNRDRAKEKSGGVS